MPDALRVYLEEIQDLACAPLLGLMAERVCELDAEVEPEVGAFGVRFHRRGQLLCELSVFGELFIARVGQAVEYRVRNHEVARLALDHILREYVRMLPVPAGR